MTKVFYGFTGNEEISIGVIVFKNAVKGLDDENNFCFLIDYFDSRDSRAVGNYERYLYPITAEGDEHQIKDFADSFSLEELLKSLYKIPKSSKLNRGGATLFSATIRDGSIKKQGSKDIYNGKNYYVGLRYENRNSSKVKDLILTLKINQNDKGVNFKCFGNGEKTIQKSNF